MTLSLGFFCAISVVSQIGIFVNRNTSITRESQDTATRMQLPKRRTYETWAVEVGVSKIYCLESCERNTEILQAILSYDMVKVSEAINGLSHPNWS
jgi:hypothetical protein